MGQVINLVAALETIVCWGDNCGIHFAVPQTFMNQARAHGTAFYCPRGCKICIGESDVQKLQKQLDRTRQRLEWAERNEKSARHAASVASGKLKAQKERVANGVCPCCKRSFTNLRRHMDTKHPNFSKEE